MSEFDALKNRLEQIVEEVSSDDISLDEALALYEEAVNIGLSACDVSEIDISDEAVEIAEMTEVAVITEELNQ